MSGKDAYEGEMAFLRQLSDEDCERALAGDAGVGPRLAEVAEFARRLRATLPAAPDEARSSDLVRQLAEVSRAGHVVAARESAAAQRPRPRSRSRSRFALVARVGVVTASLLALMAGLAIAGVKLPGPVDDVFGAAGISLPNQAEDAATGDEAGPGRSHDAGAPGKGRGGDNAAAKRGHGRDKSNPARDAGRGNGAQGKGRALGKRGMAPGRTKPKGGSGPTQSGDSGKTIDKAGVAPPVPPAKKPVVPPGQAKK